MILNNNIDKLRQEAAIETLRNSHCSGCSYCFSGMVRECPNNDCPRKQAIIEALKALESMDELLQYWGIGTVGECRAAVEKQKRKRPFKFHGEFGETEYECKRCGFDLRYGDNYCYQCGQKIDWGENPEGEQRRE